MTNLLKVSFVACLWLGALAPAQAAEMPRQYDVELLIFRNLTASDNGELWPREATDGWEDAAAPRPSSPLATVQWLPRGGSRLQAERAALDRSGRYRTLAYLAWRQAVTDRADARPVPLSERTGDGAWIDGTATVAVERYLHLALDLQLHLPDTGAQAAQIRLTEQRRMRSRELHYFDNPRFGVIAVITPYEAPASVPDTAR